MEDELPRYIRIIQAAVSKIWRVDEDVTNVHLSEALRKESDRSGFRAKPRAKKTEDEANDTKARRSVTHINCMNGAAAADSNVRR